MIDQPMSAEDDDALPFGAVEFDRETGISEDQARAVVDGMQQRQGSALSTYRLYRNAGLLERQRILSYRCAAHRCLLLDMVRTPVGPAVFLPSFRFSPDANTETDATARLERTTDGERRWVERADTLAVMPAGNGFDYWVNCDHVHNQPVPADDLHRMVTRPPNRPILI